MLNDQSVNDTEPVGGSKPRITDSNRDLLALEAQLDDLIAQLHAAQKESSVPTTISDQLLAGGDSAWGNTESMSVSEAQTKHIEAILERLYPIERAIMAAPAYSIIGLGVKARHAAYAMSQYWEEPTDKIEWEAKIIRSLIEAVCEVACTPLSYET
jgi:hypothetical protein